MLRFTMYLKGIGLLIAGISCLYALYYFGFYKNWLYGCYGKISFESFKALYAMNPELWTLWDGYVEYTKYQQNGTLFEARISGRLGFNQIDALKYQNWRRKLEKQKEQERMTESYQEILNALQDDINAYKERNNVS